MNEECLSDLPREWVYRSRPRGCLSTQSDAPLPAWSQSEKQYIVVFKMYYYYYIHDVLICDNILCIIQQLFFYKNNFNTNLMHIEWRIWMCTCMCMTMWMRTCMWVVCECVPVCEWQCECVPVCEWCVNAYMYASDND